MPKKNLGVVDKAPARRRTKAKSADKGFVEVLSTTCALTFTLPHGDIRSLNAEAHASGHSLETYLTDLIGKHAEKIRLRRRK